MASMAFSDFLSSAFEDDAKDMNTLEEEQEGGRSQREWGTYCIPLH
jgi:hypothetical protein